MKLSFRGIIRLSVLCLAGILAAACSDSGGNSSGPTERVVWEDTDGLSGATLLVREGYVLYARDNNTVMSKNITNGAGYPDSETPLLSIDGGHMITHIAANDDYMIVLSSYNDDTYLNAWNSAHTRTAANIKLEHGVIDPHVTAGVHMQGGFVYIGTLEEGSGLSSTFINAYNLGTGAKLFTHSFDDNSSSNADDLHTFAVSGNYILAGGKETVIYSINGGANNPTGLTPVSPFAAANPADVATKSHWIKSNGEYALEIKDSGKVLVWKWNSSAAPSQTASIDSGAAANLRAMEFSEDKTEGMIITRRTGVFKEFNLATGTVTKEFSLNDTDSYKRNGINPQFRDVHKTVINGDTYYVIGGEFDNSTGMRGRIYLYKNPSGNNPKFYHEDVFPYVAYSMWLEKIAGTYYIVTKDWKQKAYEPVETYDRSGKLDIIRLIADN